MPNGQPDRQAQPAQETILPVPVERLRRAADLGGLEFETTADLAPLPGLSDQPRAYAAINSGTAISQRGFNIFVIGASGARMQQSVKTLLEEAAKSRPLPADWVYVNNFALPHRPVAISLPGRRGPAVQKAVHDLIEDLQASLPAIFESDDYQKRRSSIEQSIQAKNERAFAALSEKATARNVAILRTPMGFGMAPVRNGKVVPPAEFNAWTKEEQRAIREAIQELEKELEQTLRSIPRLEKEQRDAVRELDRETAEFAVAQPFEHLKTQFSDLPAVLQHIEAMRTDLLDNLELFISAGAAGQGAMQAVMRLVGPFDRFEVNVLVTQADHGAGAPVIEELHPTLGNLVGRIEYLQVQGALVTNFRLIKAGALHRANGGTILLDARSLLMEPFSWAALKRALLRQEVTIEDVARFIGWTTTVSLEPDPIPLDVKVVLFGDRMLYHLLAALDPDVGQHFKVLADFDDEAGRSSASEAMLARLIGGIATQEKLRPLDRGGVSRAVEHAARLADDANKLTAASGTHARLDCGGEPSGRSWRQGHRNRRRCGSGHHSADPARITAQGAQPGDDPAGYRTDRDRRCTYWPGERTECSLPGGLCLWPAVTHQQPGAAGRRQNRRYRTRGGIGRTAPLEGRTHSLRLHCRSLRAGHAHVALRQPRVRTVVRRC